MVSIFTKVGVALFALGIGITFLVTAIRFPIPLMVGTYGQSISMEPIPINGSYVDIKIPGSYSHPFSSMQLTIRSTILGEPGEEVHGNIKLLYSGKGVFGELNAWGDSYFYLNSGDTDHQQQLTQHFSLGSKYSTSSFSLYLRISCDPTWNPDSEYTGNLFLEKCEMEVLYTLFAMVLPPIFTLIGSGVCIGGFIINYRKLAAKPKPREVPSGWEPSLKMGTAFAPKEKKEPKVAIKPTTPTEKPAKKVAKKAVPTGGPTHTCKFCGKNVPTSAFFCPHCYGKLR